LASSLPLEVMNSVCTSCPSSILGTCVVVFEVVLAMGSRSRSGGTMANAVAKIIVPPRALVRSHEKDATRPRRTTPGGTASVGTLGSCPRHRRFLAVRVLVAGVPELAPLAQDAGLGSKGLLGPARAGQQFLDVARRLLHPPLGRLKEAGVRG